MANKNRLKVYYEYRCLRCCRTSWRGSSAKTCDRKQCGGPLVPVYDPTAASPHKRKCRTKPPRLMA